MSVHKLRIKNLVSVVEVSHNELESVINAAKPKAVIPIAIESTIEEPVLEEVGAEETARKSNKRKKEL
jgi:hypothetical protein